MNGSPAPEYEGRLRDILVAHDWQALREFTREQNEVPDDVYAQEQHFWEVLMHKLICNRIDTMGISGESRAWLSERGYTSDLGGY